jgi:hypothetical protein
MGKLNQPIALPFGIRREIAKDLHVSEVTVWAAITGRTNSALAKRIRLYAKEKLESTLSNMNNLDIQERT